MESIQPALPILLVVACVGGFAVFLLVLGNIFNPRRPRPVKGMPYESGMDPIHDARRRIDIRFHLLAIAFLVFDVELLFLYPWAVASQPAVIETVSLETAVSAAVEAGGPVEAAPVGIDAAVAAGLVDSRRTVFAGVMVFVALLTLGLVYDWRKGIFEWR